MRFISRKWLPIFSLYLMCFLEGRGSVAKRFEVDLLRLMNGTFASTTLSTTISLNNGSATAVFSGDTSISLIEEVYLLFATTKKHVAEVRLSNLGTGKLSSFYPPHVPVETDKKGQISFSITNNRTWSGQATVEFPSMNGQINKYAMAAKLYPGDPESPSSYICSYSLKNAALSIPDLCLQQTIKRTTGLSDATTDYRANFLSWASVGSIQRCVTLTIPGMLRYPELPTSFLWRWFDLLSMSHYCLLDEYCLLNPFLLKSRSPPGSYQECGCVLQRK